MDFEGIAAIAFIAFLAAFLFVKRSKLSLQKILFPILYLVMYKTQLGIALMDKAALRFKKTILVLSYIGIGAGFLGMAVIAYTLVATWIQTLTAPSAAAGVALVLPFKMKGAFFVPFFYWAISIFIIAVVHEFAHGIVARLHKVHIKSSGFAFLGILLPILPAAFVEPDEKQLSRLKPRHQLAVFAAGPFSNVILGFLCLGLLLLVMPAISGSMLEYNGVNVASVDGSYPAAIAGIIAGDRIVAVDDVPTLELVSLSGALSAKKPGDAVSVTTVNIDATTETQNLTLAANPNNSSAAYLGVMLSQSTRISPGFIGKYGSATPYIIVWLLGLVFWLYVLNLGIGLFNLVPIGPIDGGRMLKVALEKFMSKKTAAKAWSIVSWLFLFLIAANLLSSFF